MESEHTAKTLQIALGSYDRKELRVEKNYLQEQSPALECTCFQNGGRLLEQLRQGRQFDVVILCSQLEDMSGLEFLMNIRSMDPKPNVVLFDEGRRQNTSAICLESGDGFCYVGHAELKNLLWELYRLPGRQSQRMERKCQELYEGWGLRVERAPEKGTQAVVTIPLCTDRIMEPTVELHTGGDTAQAQQHQYQLRNMLVRELRTMPERGDPDEL